MAYTNNQYDITELAKVDANGFQAALFPQIKDAYVKKMKEIYGEDIDVSSASADGQFVMAQSLVLNNIYRTLESLSDNLSPASASGKYLDILASLSGASRQGRTYSTAQVYIANSDIVNLAPSYLLLNDKNGNQWEWINPIGLDGKMKVVFPGKSGGKFRPVAITVTCTELGAVHAAATGLGDKTLEQVFALDPRERGGNIFETVNASGLLVYQNDPATAGYDEESDASLRARRLRSFGQSGRTVEDSLVANLLAVAGVIDAYAVPNNSNAESAELADKTKVPAHSVYPIVALQPGVTVPDTDIALAIYNTMTPGIPTYTPDSPVGGTKHSDELSVTEALSNTIMWKQCDMSQPIIYIWFGLRNNTPALSADQQTAIAAAVLGYLNGVAIGEDMLGDVLKQITESADFRTTKYGLPTYSVTGMTYRRPSDASGEPNIVSGKIQGQALTVPLTKFNYTTVAWSGNGSAGPFWMAVGDKNTAWPLALKNIGEN